MANLALIKKLRESTGCGIGDCNKALAECGDDFEKSIDWLRKKGLSSAAKKSSRVTTEGLIGLMVKDNKAVIVEVNSETDFVARNDKFQTFVKNITETSLEVKSNDNFVEELKALKLKNGTKIVGEELTDNIGVIGENLQLRRGKVLENDGGIIITYLHNKVSDNLGKIGVLLSIKSDADKEKLQEFGKKIAMHIAAAKPEFLTKDKVDPARLTREREVLAEQTRQSGKPENIIEKMIEGRIRKYYEDVVLLDQFFVMEDKKKVSAVVADFEKEVGTSVELKDYILYVLGEGLEKREDNFAQEVASMTQK